MGAVGSDMAPATSGSLLVNVAWVRFFHDAVPQEGNCLRRELEVDASAADCGGVPSGCDLVVTEIDDSPNSPTHLVLG